MTQFLFLLLFYFFLMGNNMTLCGSQPHIQEILTELQSCPTHHTNQEHIRLRTSQCLKQRPIFSKIKPIQNDSQDLLSEESQFQLQYTGQKLSIRQESLAKKISQYPMQEIIENEQPYYDRVMSLEELFQREELNLKKSHRIGVNWHSFIKIKKRNYLEDYIFVKEIGKGAYGSVLKVKMKYGGLLRAAKIIKSSLVVKDKNVCGKLFAQILVPMKLDHPNLVKLYEVFEFKGQYVLAMELCQGGDLFSYIKQARFFNQVKAGVLIRQILSAVNYMHKQKVVHRDLKPENILVDPQNQTLKIADFGTAIFINQNIKLIDFVGTPYYMAPEVITGSYDCKCDIWSCGIILYILLCGSPPFNGKNQKEIMQKIRIKPLQFKSPIWSKRNKDAKQLITRMLNKNPSQRCTAEEALNSKWLNNLSNQVKQDKATQIVIEKEVVHNLQNFHFKNRLKAVVYTYIASQLYSTRDKEHLLSVFKQIDKDGDGVIQKEELITIFNTHSKSSLSDSQIEKILQIVDTNGSGQIDFTEFLVAASNEEQLLQQKRLQNAFNYLDTDHSGFISIDEVRVFLDGTQQTNDEIKHIFDEVDQNGDGTISKKEFITLLLRKS